VGLVQARAHQVKQPGQAGRHGCRRAAVVRGIALARPGGGAVPPGAAPPGPLPPRRIPGAAGARPQSISATGALSYANAAGRASAEDIHRVFTVVQHTGFAAVLGTDT